MMSNPGSSRSNREPQHSQSTVSNSASRNHPLFPAVDASARNSFQALQALQKLESNFTQFRGEVKAMQIAVNELKELIEKQTKANFSLKNEGYEAALRTGLASLYCDNLTREIGDQDCANLIKRVLKNEAQHRYKTDVSKKYCKKMISVFKTEERRRVLGIAPCQQNSLWSTERLAYSIMDYLKAPDSKSETYIKHLALIRKYVRDVPQARQTKHFHLSFKKWIEEKFSGSIDWNNIMDQDKQHDYSVSPNTASTAIVTEESGSAGLRGVEEEITTSPLYGSE